MKPTEQKTTLSESEKKHRNLIFPVAIVFLFGVFTFQLWFHATRTSATIDESPHIFAGYRYWQCGDFGVNPEHPPLLKLLAALPLISKDLIQPSWECGSKITSGDESYSAGNLFLVKNNSDNIVIPTRLSAALLSLFLALMVFLAAREMFGDWEAIIALALLAFEPNIIAHGSLVMTDMAVAATMFAAVYAFYCYRKNPTWMRFLVVGLATGATLASKHSGILILPVLFTLLIIDLFIARRTEIEAKISRRFLRRVATFAGIVLIGFGVLWAFYGFRYDAVPNDSQPPALVASIFDGAPPEIINSPVVKTMRAVSVIFPESYAAGFFYVMRAGSREILFLLLPAFLFFVVSLNAGLNIGVRHILPAYPFFIVIAAAGASLLGKKISNH